MNKKLISFLIPAYNEADNIDQLRQRLNKISHKLTDFEFEFFLVNDGSNDQTMNLIRQWADNDKRVKYVNLSRNFGKELALTAGIDHVNGSAVLIMDADLQDPPELVEEMIKYWQEGYDDIYATRLSRDKETFTKKITSKLFYKILQSSTKIPIQKNAGDFRLLDQKCILAIRQFRENQRYNKGIFDWIGYRKKEITFHRQARFSGQTKYNYFKLINLAIDGLTSFTTTPLRWATILGSIISIFTFIYIIVIVFHKLFIGNTVSGYPSLMAVILFLGGVQLLSLGIIGEYIGKIFHETKNRPLYLIEDSNLNQNN